MAARTGINLGAAWSATVAAPNQEALDATPHEYAPCNTVTLSAIGAGGGWSNTGGPDPSFPSSAYHVEVYHPESPPTWDWYYPFTLAATAGANSDSKVYWIKIWGDAGVPAFAPLPVGAVIVENITASVAITLSGVYLKAWMQDANPSLRGFLWVGDRTSGYSWYADEDSIVTSTVIGPDSTVLSASAALAEAGGELELGLAPWLLNATVSCNYFQAGDTVYARVSGLKWGTRGMPNVMDLYNPGSGDAPDPTYNPNWKRAGSAGTDFRVGPDGNVGMWCEAASASPASYAWTITPPRVVTFKPATGHFHDRIDPDPEIEVSGTPIQWTGSPPASSPDPFTGTETFAEDLQDSSRFNYEKQVFSSPVMALSVTDEWRETNGEDVNRDEEGAEPPATGQDDKQCALYMHPLDVSALVGDPRGTWGTLFGITAAGNLQVVKPSGVARPANWVGSGGLTPDGANNDLWHVSSGSAAPKATLTLAERYTARMERHFDHAEDEYWYHNETALYYNKANPPESIEDLIDPPETRIPENVWHWKNRSAGRLDITAPRAGTVTITVNYKEPVYDFPFYTSGSANWGSESPSSLSWTENTVSWSVSVSAGANQVAFDLALPDSGPFDPQIHVVTSIEIKLPSAASNEDWTLSEITLLPLDPNAPSKLEAELSSVVHEQYDPYNWRADYTGFRGVLCGKRIFAIPSGQDGMVGVERSLMIRQKRRHDPDSEAEGILDYAKTASQLCGKINSQEGFTASYGTLEDSADNKDAEDNYLLGTFRAFDIRHVHEFEGETSAIELSACPKVISVSVPYGIVGLPDDPDDEGVVLYYDKYPQGRYGGIAFENDRSDRKRREGALYLWKRPLSGGAWSLADEDAIVPDRFGYFRSLPDKEKDWYYGIADSSTSPPSAGSEFRNRELVWRTITIPSGDTEVAAFDQIFRFGYVFYGGDSIRHVYSTPHDYWFANHRNQAHYAQPKIDSAEAASSFSGYTDTNGRIRFYFLRSGALYRETSPNWGYSWGTTAPTGIVSADEAFVFRSWCRSRQHCLWISGGTLYHSSSHDHMATLDETQTIASEVDTAQPTAIDTGQYIHAFALVGGTLTRWSSPTRGRTWSAAVSSPITGADAAYVVRSYDGSRQHCVYAAGGVLYHAASHDCFGSVDEQQTISASIDEGRVALYDGAQALFAFGYLNGQLACWKSLTRGRVWSLVGVVDA